MVESAAPALGPESASCAANVFARLSISLVHCPADADPSGTSSAQLANTNATGFMIASMFARAGTTVPVAACLC